MARPGEITQFEWDENKRQQNLAKHGVDFLRAALVFDGRPAVMLYHRGAVKTAGRPSLPLKND